MGPHRPARIASPLLLAIAVGALGACRSAPEPLASVDRSWHQEGLASWYGPDFHGRLTANGEVYDMYAMTAAHKTLPFDTVVEVRNLDNGRFVQVRINDRGPFVRGRVIDLSYSAADKLGLVGPGTARVRLRVVGEMELPGRRFTVQVAAYADPLAARDLEKRLRGYPHVRVHSESGIHRVLVGAFKKRKKAEKLARRLVRDGYETYVRVDLGG